jgi:small subunit ribosomal protein S18
MAKQRRRPVRRRDRKGGPTSIRRKSCPYCRDKIEQVDFKDISTLRRFISDRGKIRSRRITGACRRHQSQVGGGDHRGGRGDRGDRGDRDR